MMFLGAKFCSHCGAQARREEVNSAEPRPCPRCNVETIAVVLGQNQLRECPKCEGLWADAESVNQIYMDREQQAAILGTARDIPTSVTGSLEVVRYLRCPACSQLMHRVNFAKCSSVIVDVCKPHGTWFDKDELRRIVEFIRAGGMDKARTMEMRELDRQRRALESERAAAQSKGTYGSYGSGWDSTGLGWEIASSIASALLDGW
jgi:Zn-finger nucleic acid-binding protein